MQSWPPSEARAPTSARHAVGSVWEAGISWPRPTIPRHVYEGLGRMAEAARTVDRFIELTRPLQHAQPRMMSLHDGGLIRWKAGWPAAANAAFAEMVRVVDEQERGHHWAGEYFERIGDLPRALQYYRKGAALDPEERSLNLAGRSRHRTFPDRSADGPPERTQLISNPLMCPCFRRSLRQAAQRLSGYHRRARGRATVGQGVCMARRSRERPGSATAHVTRERLRERRQPKPVAAINLPTADPRTRLRAKPARHADRAAGSAPQSAAVMVRRIPPQ